MAQGRSTKILSMIKWTRTSKLPIKIFLSLWPTFPKVADCLCAQNLSTLSRERAQSPNSLQRARAPNLAALSRNTSLVPPTCCSIIDRESASSHGAAWQTLDPEPYTQNPDRSGMQDLKCKRVTLVSGWVFGIRDYRGTSLMRKRPPLGP